MAKKKEPNWLEKLLFGSNVKKWSDTAHKLTKYKYYVIPDAEQVFVPKTRWKALNARPFRWPESFKGLSVKETDPGSVNMYGSGSGYPMQMGREETRSVTYGWAKYGEQKKIRIPKPLTKRYWIRGDPTPAHDKNACVVAPDGDVFELIQFDQDAPETIIANQALGVGQFRNTELVNGTTTGAGKVANSAYVWDRMSKLNRHTVRLTTHDYFGHDGLLPETMEGYDVPKIGDFFVLSVDSPSYKRNVAKKGDCAELAISLSIYGCRLLDRSGYSDVKNNATDIGKKPYAPDITLQAGNWPGSNIGEFTMAIEDLLYVTDFEVQ